MIDNSTNPDLSAVYSEDGVEFFAHNNPMDISPIRGVAAERARRFLDMNITQGTLKKLLNEISTAFGKNDFVLGCSILQEIKYRLEYICEENSILEFVCIYYLLKDEDPKTFNPVFTERKMKIFEADEKARSFFLHIGLSLIDKFTKLPEIDLRVYLEEMKMNAQRITPHILNSILRDSKTI